MSASDQTPYTREWLERTMGHLPPRFEPRKVGAGDGDTYVVGTAIPAGRAGLEFKDHEITLIVNELRRLALDYGASQQFRDRISNYIAPILRGEKRP